MSVHHADTRPVPLRLPRTLLSQVDALVEQGLYVNRQEVIRAALRQLLAKEAP